MRFEWWGCAFRCGRGFMEACTHPLVHFPTYCMVQLTLLWRISQCIASPATRSHCLIVMVQELPVELHHPTSRPGLTKYCFLVTWITYFIPRHYYFSFFRHPLSQRPRPTPLCLGQHQSAGMTFRLSSNLIFSSRFCAELLDAFPRPPQPIIICLGLSGDHCLLSLGSS